MPNSREMLLNILYRTKTRLKDKVSPFQIECLEMLQKKIRAIQVDEFTETNLLVCNILLDQCFCDLEDMVPRESRIIGLINKANLSNEDFYTKINHIFDKEIKKLNHCLRDAFYDQTFINVKRILIDMKTELTRLKTALDHKIEDAKGPCFLH